MNRMTVSIIIPNWNGKVLLEKHMPAVIRASGGNEIIIVDDGSTDDSIVFIQKNYPSVRCISRTHHQGFASTVNAGVAQANGEIIILLNTDIEPTEHFIDPLLGHFDDPKVFAVGCMDKSHEGDRIVLRGRGIAWWQKGFFIHARGDVNAEDTAWVSGGSGAFRKSAWNELGGMDPIFNPFYWEDIDLSYRSWKSGWTIMFEPKSIVHHFHESGIIKTVYTPDYIKTISYRNQFIFIWKNATDTSIVLSHLLWLLIRVGQAIVRGDTAFLHGLFAAIRKFSEIQRRRKQTRQLIVRHDASFAVYD